jgi:hypothetical protein
VQLSEQRLHMPWKQKVFTKLIELQYQIVYRKGVDNCAAELCLVRQLCLVPQSWLLSRNGRCIL